MTGPQHYAASEQLLEHAARTLDTDVAREDRADLVARETVVATMAHAHAVLAAAPRSGSARTKTTRTRRPGPTGAVMASQRRHRG